MPTTWAVSESPSTSLSLLSTPGAGTTNAASSSTVYASPVATGAAFGGEVRNPFTGLEGPQGTGHFFIALKADLFMSLAAFTQRMQTLVQRVKTQPLAEGFDEIQIPGEPEHRMEIARLENGIPLSPDVIEALKSEADLAGVSFPAL